MKRPAAATAKKPAAATAKKPAAAKKQAAAKKPAADVETVVRVKYTHPMNPVRTYCQAVGEGLCKGIHTFQASKLRKADLLQTWGQ